MTVECKITDYNHVEVGGSKVTIRSGSASDEAKIEFEGISCTINIDEAISALEKCRLNCFGR